MNEGFWKGVLDQAQKLHEKAVRESTMKLKGIIYRFRYNPYQQYYEVYKGDSDEILMMFNTRKITVAKKWLKEYYEN